MLTGVWGEHFYVVVVGISFMFVLLASILSIYGMLLLRLFVAGTFVFIIALLLRGILLLLVCYVNLDHSMQIIVSKYVRLSRLGRVASRKRAWVDVIWIK